MERQNNKYSNQKSNSTFQPQSHHQSGFQQVNLGRPETHSNSAPANGNSHHDSIKIQAGDTLWGVAEKKLGNGSRWTELQKKDGNTFTNREAHQLQIGTEVYLPKVQLTDVSQSIPGLQVQGGDLKANSNGITLQVVKSDKPTVGSFKAENSSFTQSESTHFSGADLIKAVQFTQQRGEPHQVKTQVALPTMKTASTSHQPALSQSKRLQVASQSSAGGAVQDKSHLIHNAQEVSSTDNKNFMDLGDGAKGAAIGAYVAGKKLAPKPVLTEASRTAKAIVDGLKDEKGKPVIKPVRVGAVRFSQATVSPIMGDKKTPLKSVADSMEKHGWNHTAEPPDMVKFGGRRLSLGRVSIPISRGHITTLDHRRVVAAKAAGLKKIPARIHAEHDPINPDVPSRPGAAGQAEATRFQYQPLEMGKKTPSVQTESIYKEGHTPKTWGEAVRIRAARQVQGGHSNFPSTGSKELPKIKSGSSEASKIAAEALRGSATKGIARGVLRGASRAAMPVAAAVDAYDLTKTYQKDGFGSKFRSKAAGVAGGWAGAAAGAEIGATVGSFVPIPFVGTAGGALVGGAAGYLIGSGVASKAEEGIEKAVPKVWEGAKSAGSSIANEAKSAWHSINPFD